MEQKMFETTNQMNMFGAPNGEHVAGLVNLCTGGRGARVKLGAKSW